MIDERYEVLNQVERMKLTGILKKHKNYYDDIKNHILNADRLACNAMIIFGPAGTGKTTVASECLADLEADGVIDSMVFKTGHVTMTELISLIGETAVLGKSGKRKVLLLDDVDIWNDPQKIVPLKSALDTKNTKNPNNRRIKGCIDPVRGTTFDAYYQGYCIIITNNEFKSLTVDQAALLSRVCVKPSLMELSDGHIFALHQAEEIVTRNERNLTDEQRDEMYNFIVEDLRPWLDLGVFEHPNLNPICKYSLRLLESIVDDIIVFANDWKSFNVKYRLLNKLRKSLES